MQEIYDLVNASLSKLDNSRILSTILLLGPAGSGKRYSVTTICDLLNLAVLDVDLFSLLSDTLEKTAANFYNVIDKATKMSPCVLLLHNLQALSESWSGQGINT